MRARRGDNWEFASTEPWLSSPFQFGENEPEKVLHKTEADSEIKQVPLIVTHFIMSNEEAIHKEAMYHGVFYVRSSYKR